MRQHVYDKYSNPYPYYNTYGCYVKTLCAWLERQYGIVANIDIAIKKLRSKDIVSPQFYVRSAWDCVGELVKSAGLSYYGILYQRAENRIQYKNKEFHIVKFLGKNTTHFVLYKKSVIDYDCLGRTGDYYEKTPYWSVSYDSYIELK